MQRYREGDVIISAPYLSFVFATRNDNYGGNLLHRTQAFINTFLELVEKYNLDAELVIVEWNPQKNRSRLKDAIIWLKNLKSIKVRIIEVPNEIHRKLPNSDKTPFFEWIAKNVGIRRSRGEYVLVTNPDIIFNEELIEFLATKPLAKGCFYRIDRYDVNKLIPLDISVQDQMKFCEKHIYRVNKLSGSFKLSDITNDYIFFMKSLFLRFKYIINSFLSSHRICAKKVKTSNESQIRTFAQASTRDKFSMKDLFLRLIHIIIYFLSIHLPSKRKVKPPPEAQMGIHTHASGDFILMARQYWFELMGYPEFKTSSYVDSYMCFQAASLGLQQIVFERPLRIYHQEHSRSDKSNRPKTDFQQYLEDGKRMLETKQPLVLNSEDWGLSSEKLSEYQIKL